MDYRKACDGCARIDLKRLVDGFQMGVVCARAKYQTFGNLNIAETKSDQV